MLGNVRLNRIRASDGLRAGARFAALVLAMAATLPAAAQGRDERPILLLMHSGGFVIPGDMHDAAALAPRYGFEPRDIQYTLGDPLQAWRDVRAAALRGLRSGRRVYAYGSSAGGTLAVLLAEHRLVEAAAADAPPGDLTNWGEAEMARLGIQNYWEDMPNHGATTRRFLSPILSGTSRPVLLQQDAADPIVPFGPNAAWAKRERKVWLRISPTGHDGPQFAAQTTPPALAWLQHINESRALLEAGERNGPRPHDQAG
jgi:acetyl esterase/lipase